MLCLLCTLRRENLLTNLESGQQGVRFEAWKWKVAYCNPATESEGWRQWGNEEAAHRAVGIEEMERRLEALRREKTAGGRVMRVGFVQR